MATNIYSYFGGTNNIFTNFICKILFPCNYYKKAIAIIIYLQRKKIFTVKTKIFTNSERKLEESIFLPKTFLGVSIVLAEVDIASFSMAFTVDFRMFESWL